MDLISNDKPMRQCVSKLTHIVFGGTQNKLVQIGSSRNEICMLVLKIFWYQSLNMFKIVTVTTDVSTYHGKKMWKIIYESYWMSTCSFSLQYVPKYVVIQ